MKNRMRNLFIFCILAVVMTAGLAAQDAPNPPAPGGQKSVPDVSDDQLESFVEVHEQINEVQMKINEETSDVIDESDFSQQEVQQIFQAGGTGSGELSQEEQELVQQIEEIQKNHLETQVEILEDEGLSVDDYNNVIVAIQNDPDTNQRYQEMAN